VQLYVKAGGDGFAVQSPAESPLEYSDYPPFPPEWHKLAKAAREANADRVKLARQARTAPRGQWPPGPLLPYLNTVRALANELGDAALYEQTQGNHAEAVESVRDIFALARSLRATNNRYSVQLLVSVGIDALGANRLMVMGPGLEFTEDEANRRNVSPAVVRELIGELTAPRDIGAELAAAAAADPPPMPGEKPIDIDRVALQVNRSYAEQHMLAMSLACQLFRNRNGHWPESAAQLVPDFMPKLPADPFGNGREAIGYLLVKGGLPDGGDRPLVYSLGNSKDGLFFRLDEPHYSFYRGDGSDKPDDQQKQGGQFRDVSRWTPVKLPPGAPRTRQLAEPVL
jgi:hypothetical protein